MKHHKTKSSTKSFNDSCIQKYGTIIQPKHQGASVKGSSRSSKLKYVPDLTGTIEPNSQTKKYRSTAKRVKTKDHVGHFMFSVFLSVPDKL